MSTQKNQTWQEIIEAEKQLDYFESLTQFVENERVVGKQIYPADVDVFNAFDLTPFEQVNVVILGQDPYHGADQAHGLCFSVLPNVKTPPSLVNIYKELHTDIENFEIPQHGNLATWAEQGVLLLNTVLTVEQSKAHSHSKIGWETFTDHIIESINQQRNGVIFLLWGAHAQKKGRFIDRDKHYVLEAKHPSPLSAYRGFFGCQHFSKTNQILEKLERPIINWQVPL